MDDVPAVLERRRRQASPDGRFGAWAVALRESQLVVGLVLLRPLEEDPDRVEVGWHLDPDHWGNGYATEAARGAIEKGFAEGLDEIVAVVDPENHPSQAVCRRLGMAHIGRTRQFYDAELELFELSRTWGGSPSRRT